LPDRGKSRADRWFRLFVLGVASAIPLLCLLYFLVLSDKSWPTLARYGLGFLTGPSWNPVRSVFGALPMVYGSLVTSAIALLLAVPISVGVAVFLSEISPRRLMRPVSFLVEMLAAVPSVIYGLWGIFVLVPLLRVHVYPALRTYLGFLPLFQGNIYGFGMLTAGIILAIMIIPIVSSISRDALQAVPDSQREALYALGGTRSEVIRTAVLGYARPGVIAAVFLGFGRAFGETMAVTMLIGNTSQISASLFAPGYTLASLIANQYSEAVAPLYISAIIEIGLVLLLVSFAANLVGQLIVRRFVAGQQGGGAGM
jgi:phosphate transport system permease protein